MQPPKPVEELKKAAREHAELVAIMKQKYPWTGGYTPAPVPAPVKPTR